MILTSDLNPTNGFTRVLNEVIFDDRLSHAEFRLWCRLLAMPKGAKSMTTDTEAIAKEVGMTVDLCRTHRRNLREKGFLTGDKTKLVVTMPPSDFEPKEVTLSAEQQLRQDLRDAWNKHKPEAFTRLRHPFSESQVITLGLHAEHNGQADPCAFLAGVLKGCKADDWWKEKSLGVTNVFGSGRPKQNKYTNVEKLFKLGNSKKATAALFDVADDQCWIDWYVSKGHEMTRVERLQMERNQAWEHQVDNDGNGVIYIYSNDDRLVHWTYKEGQHGVSYIPTAR